MRLGHQLYKLPSEKEHSQIISRTPSQVRTTYNMAQEASWNQSVEIDANDFKNRFNNLYAVISSTIFSTQGSKYKNKKLIEFSESNKLSLVERQVRLQEQLRLQKQEEQVFL